MPKLTALARLRSCGVTSSTACRGGRVEVGALVEGGNQVLVSRKVREQAQLDLGVVAGQKDAAFGHGEGGPHAMAQLGAGRDVLEVGLGARQAPRCGDGLVERGVDAVVAADKRRKRIEVGALDLCALAVLQHLLDHLIVARKVAKNLGIGRVEALLGLLEPLRRQAHHVEQHVRKLLRRVKVELLARLLVNGADHALDLGPELGGLLGHLGGVGVQAAALHLEQHHQKRHLDVAEEVLGALGP